MARKSNQGYLLDADGNVEAVPGNAAVALSIIAGKMLADHDMLRTDHPLQGETFGGIESALNSIASALIEVSQAIRGCHPDDLPDVTTTAHRTNPFHKSNWDPAAQAKLVKALGMTKANEIAKAVGSHIGAEAPNGDF